MRRYPIEPRTRKYVKRYGFLSFAGKYKNQLLDTGSDTVKTASKKVVHKAGGFIENKIADAVVKLNDDKIVKQEPVEEKNYSTRKKEIRPIKNSIIKMKHYKILNYQTIELQQNLRQKIGRSK